MTVFLVDGRRRAFYLAFDLMLAEAPIRDGVVAWHEGRIARGETIAEQSALAAVRATMLPPDWPEHAAERRRSEELAAQAGLTAPPPIVRVEDPS